uniref:Uncharacterized protein n=1 Tax=Rhizophora mucronata TaxID=61149 RepID=A0A2P2QHR7_RHIMU
MGLSCLGILSMLRNLTISYGG